MSELRKIRQERGLTLDAVAYLAGIDASTLSRIENGHVQPRPKTIVTIAKALGVSVRRVAPKEPGHD